MYAACAEYFQDGKGRAYEPRTANNLANTLFWQKWFGAVEAAICNGVCAVCVLYAWSYWLWSLFTEGSGNITSLMFIAVFILLPVTAGVIQSAIEILSLAGNNKPLLTLNEQGVVYKGRVVRWSDIVGIQLGHENRHTYAHHMPDVAISLHPSAVESPRDAIMWIALRDVKVEEYLLMRQLKHYWHLYREVSTV